MGMPSAHSTPSTAIASASLAVGGMPKSSLVVTGMSEAAAMAFTSVSFDVPALPRPSVRVDHDVDDRAGQQVARS